MNKRLEDIVRKLAADRKSAALTDDDYSFLARLVAVEDGAAGGDGPRPLWAHVSRRATVFGALFDVPRWDPAMNKIFTQAGMPAASLSYEDNEQRWILPVHAPDLRRACAWALQQDDGELRLQAAVMIGFAGFEDLLQPLLDDLESGRGERTGDASGRVSGALQALAMFGHPRTAALALPHVGSDDYRIRNAARNACLLCASQLGGAELQRVLESNFEPWEFTKAPHLYVELARRGGLTRERLQQIIEGVHLSAHVTEAIAEIVFAAQWHDTFEELIAHDDADLRAALMLRAAYSGEEWTRDPLRARLDDEDSDDARMTLLAALGSFGDDFDDVLLPAFEDGSAYERAGAIWGAIDRPQWSDKVRAQLGESDVLVRAAAACVLASHEGERNAMELAWSALLNRDDWWPWALGLRALTARGAELPPPVRGFGYVSEPTPSLAVADAAVEFFREYPAELVRWLGRDASDGQRGRAMQFAGLVGGRLCRAAVEQTLAGATNVDESMRAGRELTVLGGAEQPLTRVKLALAMTQNPTLEPDDLNACIAVATGGIYDIHMRATTALSRFGRAAEPWVAELLYHPDNDINNAATEAVTRLHAPDHPVLRDVSALLDGSVRRVSELEMLPRLFNCPSRRVRETLAEAAGRADNRPEEVLHMLLRLGVDKDATVVTAATASLAAKLPDAAWIKQLLLRNSRTDDWQLTRGTVTTMAQIGDPVFVPRLVEIAMGDDQSQQDAAVRGLERVAERFPSLGLVVLDIRDPWRISSHYGLNDQIDHNADRHSESLRLLMLALDRKRNANRAVAENHRKVMLTPLSGSSEAAGGDGGWDMATFEQLALYLSVTFVDEDTGTVIAEVSTEPTGEVLSALLQTRSVCATTVAWS
ncbi:MAG: hypothetical protein K1X88_10880 [Nannocystaceae bacterium]|nr:hypothetical protein [Nannocystaceae bacterium]